MEHYLVGTQRFTASGVLGKTGTPKYVHFVTMASSAGTGAVITFYNGTDATSTANIYASVYGSAGSGNTEDLGTMYMPQGCYVALGAGSGTQYAVVQYHEAF